MFLEAFLEIFCSDGLPNTFAKHWSNGSRNADKIRARKRVRTQVQCTHRAVEDDLLPAVFPQNHRELEGPRGVHPEPCLTHSGHCHTAEMLVDLLYFLFQNIWQNFGMLRTHLNISNSSLLFDYSGLWDSHVGSWY